MFLLNKLTSAAAAFAQTNFITPINNATTDFNNLIIDDLNTLNLKNPAIAALMIQSNMDPMVGFGSFSPLSNYGLAP